MKKTLWFLFALALCFMERSLDAQTTIFSENFDGVAPGFGVTSVGEFTAINGTNVDVISATGSYSYLVVPPESGNVIDMGGNGGNPVGQLRSIPITLAPGTYALSFDLVGSERGATTTTNVTLGPIGGPYLYNRDFTLASNDTTSGIVSNAVVSVADAPETVYLTFALTATPSVQTGSLLDNVKITTAGSSLAILTNSLSSIGAGLAYNATLQATGGTGTYTWCVLDGSACDPNPASPVDLPAGFTLTPDGFLTAQDMNPALPKTYTFTVQVKDSGGHTAPRELTLTISCKVNLNPGQGGRSGSGLPDFEYALFSAPQGYSLQEWANKCGFTDFDWQQSVIEDAIPLTTNQLSQLPNPDLDPNTYAENNPAVPLVPIYLDPVSGGYTNQFASPGVPDSIWIANQPNFEGASPFYYSPLDLPLGCATWFTPYGQTFPAGYCAQKIETATELYFYDQPKSSQCVFPQSCMAFATALVGVCDVTSTSPSCTTAIGPVNAQGQWASLPLYLWYWRSNYNICPNWPNIANWDGCSDSTGGIPPNSTLSIGQAPIGSGTGGVAITSINGVPSPSVSVDPSASTINYFEPLSVEITVGQFPGKPVPAGTVTLTSGTYTSAAATLDGNGAANISVPAGSLPVGSDMLTVAYTPATPVSATYSQAWGTAMVTVNPVTPQIVFAPTPSSQAYGTPITAGSLDAIAQSNGNAVSGTFAYTTGACGGGGPILTAGTSVLDAGSYLITACFSPSQAGFAAASTSAPYTVTPANQSISFGPIAAQPVGATIPLTAKATSGMLVSFQTLTPAVCSVSSSTATMISIGTCTLQATQSGGLDYYAANPVQVSFPVMGFTLAAEPRSETVRRGVLGVFLLEVKSVNGFAGYVNISCAGGPPKSVCKDFPQSVRVMANRAALALSGILFRPQDAAGTYTITFTGISGTDTTSTTAQFIVK